MLLLCLLLGLLVRLVVLLVRVGLWYVFFCFDVG